jgi:hypothetical protein
MYFRLLLSKKKSEQKCENTPFSIGTEMYGDVKIREGVQWLPQLFKGYKVKGRKEHRKSYEGVSYREKLWVCEVWGCIILALSTYISINPNPH